ncbi:MAG: hypothetical protein AB1505_35010 [Candidatus Latescibacterota bacterium]
MYHEPEPLELDGLAMADSVARPPGAGLTQEEEQAYARLEREAQAQARAIRIRRPPSPSPAMGLFALYPGLTRPAASSGAGKPRAPDPLAAESAVSSELAVAVVEQGLGLPVPRLPDGGWVPQFDPQVWYNRVEGLHAGARARALPAQRVGLHAEGGYALGLRRLHGGAGLSLGTEPGPTLTVSRRSGARPTCTSENYSLAANTFPMLLGIADYFDYYWSRVWRAEVCQQVTARGPDLRIGLNREDHTSLAKTTDCDVLCDFQAESGRFRRWVCGDGEHDLRDNPSIRPGRLHSLDVRTRWGDPYVPRGRAPNRRVDVAAEMAGGPLGGDLAFGRLQVTVDGHWRTLLRRRADAGALDLRLATGVAWGDLPPQRLGALDVAVWRFTPFGGFRTRRNRALTGSRYAAAFWEQDLGGAPFEVLGLGDVAASGARLILHGASGHVRGGRAAGGPGALSHHEVGLSWVPGDGWRVDATRRLDGPGWWVGFSRARAGR